MAGTERLPYNCKFDPLPLNVIVLSNPEAVRFLHDAPESDTVNIADESDAELKMTLVPPLGI